MDRKRARVNRRPSRRARAHVRPRLLEELLLRNLVGGADDTPVAVQGHGGKGSKTGRLWAYHGDRDEPFVVFDYTPVGSRDGPERFLAGYRTGCLRSDAYVGFDALHTRGLVAVGCWTRARQRFFNARASDPERSHAAMAWIGWLYDVEREGREAGWDDDPLMAARGGQSRPLLEPFWASPDGESTKVLPKSAVSEAIAYALSNRAELSRNLEAPYLAIDDNAVENTLWPVAVGRENFLHLGNDRANADGPGAVVQEAGQ